MNALPPRFTISNAITAGLTAIERARGFLEAAMLSDEWVRRMSRRALLNYREAFNLVSEYLQSGEPMTEGLIRETHTRLVEGVRGRCAADDVGIGGLVSRRQPHRSQPPLRRWQFCAREAVTSYDTEL